MKVGLPFRKPTKPREAEGLEQHARDTNRGQACATVVPEVDGLAVGDEDAEIEFISFQFRKDLQELRQKR